MYLDHFGLSEPPFRITPVTEFFFSGANRGEILDALIYSIGEIEGIVKVSGEVGSGKTMLCRMLLEKLPPHIEAIYLANPSLTREEMLYAIADGLGLDIKDERVGIIMQTIQNRLEEKAREGKRVVVLVDEAHAMPLDTLEELRLLYNLQSGNAKLLQIVLFGQPELNAKLDQPNMRQLKDRIAHHFHMQPLSRNILENYLMFRMRAAGYHGPNIFSADAIKLFADASGGLLRRVNILADKSLLAAFVENTHNIEIRHVKAAIRDSELGPAIPPESRILQWGAAIAVVLLLGIAAWWMNRAPVQPVQPVRAQSIAGIKPPLPGPTPVEAPQQAPTDNSIPPAAVTPAESQESRTVTVDKPAIASPAPVASKTGTADVPQTPLFDQRMNAGRRLAEEKSAVASIQLFYNQEVNPVRMEGFLARAQKLGVLSKIYILPAKVGNQDGLRTLYGAYPSVEAAKNAVKEMPKRYQEAFATSTYIF